MTPSLWATSCKISPTSRSWLVYRRKVSSVVFTCSCALLSRSGALFVSVSLLVTCYHVYCQVSGRITLPVQPQHHAVAPQHLCSPCAGGETTVTKSLTPTAWRTRRRRRISTLCHSEDLVSPLHHWVHPVVSLPPPPTMVRNAAADWGPNAQKHQEDLFRAPVQSY